MTVVVRPATAADASAVAVIYAPYVRDTAISFETDPPDAGTMAQRIAATLPTHPWIVALDNDMVVGYAYAGPHRIRPAYRWSVDVTIYVDSAARRSGVGRALYAVLLGILRCQGFRSAFAEIVLPHPSSVGLHEAMGFAALGIHRSAGFKFGHWRDVGYWQLALSTSKAPPTEPLPPSHPSCSAPFLEQQGG